MAKNSTNSNFDDVRVEYKALIATEFQEALSTQLMKQATETFSLQRYSFMIANESQLNEISDLLSHGYHKNNVLPPIFGVPKNVLKSVFANFLRPSIENGRCFIIIDNNTPDKEIVATTCMDDFYDSDSSGALSDNPLSQFLGSSNQSNLTHWIEILTIDLGQSKLDELGNGKYGSLCHGRFGCKKDSVNNKWLILIFVLMLQDLMYNYCNYKYIFGEPTHEGTFKFAKTFNSIVWKSIDFSNFTFKDGININYYFDKFSKENNSNQTQIEKMKKRCKIQLAFSDKKTFQKVVAMLTTTVLKSKM